MTYSSGAILAAGTSSLTISPKDIRPQADPLGPDNPLIFSTSLLTGMPIAGSGRSAVGVKSPLTGAFGQADGAGFSGMEELDTDWVADELAK